MELYHKIYKMNPDLTVYLDNPQKLVEHCDEMLSHLTGARSMNELHGAKIAVLRDFYSVCSFDIQDADFPEPIGHFDSDEYSRAVTPQIRQAGNRLSGLAETAYASLLA